MPTRRQFIATTAAAVTASVLPAAPREKASAAAPTESDERSPEIRRADGELRGCITRAAVAQSVPFPEA